MAGRSRAWYFFAAENVHQRGGGEPARGQGHTARYIERDPDAPGVVVVQVGHGSQPQEQAGDPEGEPDAHEEEKSQRAKGEERLGYAMRGVVAAHRPPSFFTDSGAGGGGPSARPAFVSRRRLNHMIPANVP